jgi:cytochrome c556
MKPSTVLAASKRGVAARLTAGPAKVGVAAAALTTTAALLQASSAQPAPGAALQPTMPIKQLMETAITEASNTIWGAYDPPTSAEQWSALEHAAQMLIDATKIAAVGGTGPMDNEWAKQPAWKPFNDALLAASEAALEAARAKDHTALLAASDALYPPCEGCHLQFNPGVANQN